MPFTPPQVNKNIDLQLVLGAGSTIVYTCPNMYYSDINVIRMNNPSAYDITVSITRNGGSPTNAYTFNLAAGDVLVDNNKYRLYTGDLMTITSSIAGTNCFITGQEYTK